MLHRVSIENFQSIADQQVLSLAVPANAPDLPCFKFSPPNSQVRLPSVVGFFGPNASGKSTFLCAIVSALMFACHSFEWNNQIQFFFQPYRQKKWWGGLTKIVLEFDCQQQDASTSILYRYELHLSNNANDFFNKSVEYEALFYFPNKKQKRLFERHKQTFSFGDEFGISRGDDPRKNSIRHDASVISTLAKLNHPLAIYLHQQMSALQTNIQSFNKVQKTAQECLSIYADDSHCLEQLNRELRRFDVGIESMIIEKSPKGLAAKFRHTGLDDYIFLEEESSGTKRFIELFPRLHYALETGSVVVIDELDTDCHPLLLPELLRWFDNPVHNSHCAQLLFTAHNPTLLDELEKEQVFFTEKISGQASCIYGARDIKGLRREPSLMKKYLAGELGAIPHIG